MWLFLCLLIEIHGSMKLDSYVANLFDGFVKRKRYKGPSRHFLDISHRTNNVRKNPRSTTPT